MFFRRLNWNIVGWLRTVSIISYAVIALGIASMIYHWVTTGTPLRLGLSFTGGTDVTAKFVRPVDRDAIAKALTGIKVTDAQINTLTKPGEPPGERYTIETQTDFGNVTDPLWNALNGVAKVDRAQSSISTVGPSLASEYLLNALKALVIAIAIQFIYIAFRFGWNYIFGLVTIIALVRDSAMMIGIYSLANKRVDDAFLAAVLTVIGYSVMDTIVILDRIRENTKVMAGEPFDKIVNTSILQTMTRSVNTLATVVITLVALLAFGGASLQNFAFALLVGICSGGYHSIFYSAPLVASFQKTLGARAALRRAHSLESQPRTVAEARAQARTDADRAEILAARKARRERERQSSRRSPGPPPKYKRRRIETSNDSAIFGEVEHDHDHGFADEEYDEIDLEREALEADIDPLDAQALGHHDRDYDLGHEEIHLNLDAADEPANPARETPHSNYAPPPPTASEAAFERLVETFGRPDAAAPPSPAAAFLAELYAKQADYRERDPFGSIGESFGFNTKIVGVTFEGRQDLVAGLEPGQELELVRQPANAFDPNAVAVHFGNLQLGFVRKQIAARIAPNIDAGERYRAEVRHITGGGTRSVGVNIYVTRERSLPVRAPAEGARAQAADVQRALLGEHPLREAQHAVLERVRAGRNTLAVLGTGRGKSLCFQLPAATAALEHGAKAIVLYPLRALANDQYEALIRRLEPLGLRIFRANGAIDAAERAALMDALESGAWDIVCTTPEFMHFHADRFTHDRSRPAMLVVDEAHHLVESTHRPAYGRIGELVRKLGAPQVLALTATAGDDVFAGIRRELAIDAWVIDPTIRENLTVVEARGVTNKADYIRRNVDPEGKALVYCNSRTETMKVAEKLRVALGDTVAFYHAGVGSAERLQVEQYFRAGTIRVVVATTAFGEGIDLPDVRDVFLYHLNFDLTEFNQQSGRAGRDGKEARIHLLFGERDRSLNDFILERDAPPLHTLRSIYRGLKGIASAHSTSSGQAVIRMTNADIATAIDLSDKVSDRTIGAALRIFLDAGLLELGEDDEGRYARFLDVKEKVDLTQNERFAEGEADREAFERFCALALTAQPGVLQTIINRPIYPGNVPLRH